MEGKELYSNEDEELNPKSENDREEADDFGLPEIEDSDDDENDLGDPYSTSNDYTDSSDDYSYNDEEEAESSEDDYKPSSYEEEEQGKSPVGWIIFIVILMIGIIIAAFWWWNRTPEPEPVIEPPVIIETIEPEPEIIEEEPEPVKQAGVYDLSEPTGNYHVIIASSIDVDLVRDYATKLANEGMVCNILAPRGNKKFHRLSVAEYASIEDATLESERLKGTLGEDVWVIRY